MLSDILFKKTMGDFPSGVTIVTTTDADGNWRGFTASSFCSLSVDPPLVLVCLAKSAECHDAFLGARHWNIHFVSDDHTETAMRFAQRGADKFAGSAFQTDANGTPKLTDAARMLQCVRHDVQDGGDHAILIGRVTDIETADHAPVYYVRGSFHATAQPADVIG